MPEFAVLIPAAGRSTRFGGPVNKLLQILAGQAVLTRSLAAFAQRSDVAQIVIATADPDAATDCIRQLSPQDQHKIKIVPGGTCRAESVREAAQATDESIEWLAVHDAARPLISQALIDRVFLAAIQHGAAAAAMAVHLTIKQAVGPLPAKVQRTVPRTELWAMQTPQVMRRADLLAAMESCPIPLADVTDDVQLLELQNQPVWLVEGEHENLKITTASDLHLAEKFLAAAGPAQTEMNPR